MTFWNHDKSLASSSELDRLLEENAASDLSLETVLSQENVIQECKAPNNLLIEYLTTPEVLGNLIRLITTEPPTDLSASDRYRLPHVAAEILSCEVQKISEKISNDETLLALLYSFLEPTEPLNPLLSSFFSRAFSVLITRKSTQNWYQYQYSALQVLEFIKKKEFVADLLRHIATSSVSDLIVSLVSCIEGQELRQNVLDWLNEKQLIESIIRLLDPAQEKDAHDNASRLLIEIHRVARDAQHAPPNERCQDALLRTLEEPATFDLLLEVMFRRQEDGELCESTLVNGMDVLRTLVETRSQPLIEHAKATQNSTPPGGGLNDNSIMSRIMIPEPEPLTPAELASAKKLLDATVASLVPRLGDITRLLVEPPRKAAVRTTAGVLDPPLGATRLGVARLVATLLATAHPDVNAGLMQHRTIDVLLDLFFKYSLNNFLHREVEQCLSHIFEWNPSQAAIQAGAEESMETEEEGDKKEAEAKEEDGDSEEEAGANKQNNPLLIHLFTSCRLVERVLDAWDENESGERQAGGPSAGRNRKGYMGHLTKIANILVQSSAAEAGSSNEASPSANTDHSRSSGSSSSVPAATLALVSTEMSKLPPSTTEHWSSFVTGSLAATNERNVLTPVDPYSGAGNLSSPEDDDLENSLHSANSSTQQLFADFQMQQMSENFVDTFGFGEESSGDDGGASQPAALPKLSTVNFDEDDVTGGTAGPHHDSDDEDEDPANRKEKKTPQQLFEEACSQKINPGHDSIDDDDLWADRTKEISFSPSATLGGTADDTANSSDDDDEKAKAKMEIDVKVAEEEQKRAEEDKKEQQEKKEAAWPLPTAASEAETPPIAMDTGNPWGDNSAEASEEAPQVQRSSTPPDGGWANFGDASEDAEAEAVVKVEAEAPPGAVKEAWVADFASTEAKKGDDEEKEEGKEAAPAGQSAEEEKTSEDMSS